MVDEPSGQRPHEAALVVASIGGRVRFLARFIAVLATLMMLGSVQ